MGPMGRLTRCQFIGHGTWTIGVGFRVTRVENSEIGRVSRGSASNDPDGFRLELV